MDLTDFFAVSYAQARRKFIDAVATVNGTLATYPHPTQQGPNGEALAVDVAHIGEASAPRQLIVITGTHGLEGYAGSAAQIAWLRLGNAGKLPPGLGVLLIHGLNPYGFAHFSRTTENNVDLNRNFVDHEQAHPANPDYDRLHPHLKADEWGWAFLEKMAAAEANYRNEHGADALFNARVKGQYNHPDGLFYGGQAREWSNLTLQRIIEEHLAAAQQLALIDWHTGLGKYGEPFFLCFSPEESAEYQQAVHWWGEHRISNARPHGLSRPAYSGLVFHGVSRFIGNRPLVGAVVEFGTREIAMNKVQPLDQWLRFRAPRQGERFDLLQLDLRDAYVPFSQEWRTAALRQSLEITEQAVAGLASWNLLAESTVQQCWA